MKILGKTIHGSKLYGLDGPNSDTDYKSIHLPNIEECLLLRASKNLRTVTGEGAAKEESESFALQEFLRLAANGEDVTIAMLHARDDQVLVDSDIFKEIRAKKHHFYTKRMVGALGYAKNMAFKYSLRADRMVAVEKVIAALEAARNKGVARLYQCWDDLPDGQHIVRTVSENNRDGVDKRIYEVSGKGLPATVSPEYALEILLKLRNNYGDRVNAAKNMKGQDYKAISHSFRVGYQLFHIYKNGGFVYPLPESDFIRAVKEARLDYAAERLDEKLNDLITTVEELSEKSNFPEKVNPIWLDKIILDAYYRI